MHTVDERSTETLHVQRRKLLGESIRGARLFLGMSQTELGAALPEPVPQTTISRWELGLVDLALEQVFELEDALKVAHGTLAVSAGYAKANFTVSDVEAMLRSDPHLHPELKTDFIRTYRSYLSISELLSKR